MTTKEWLDDVAQSALCSRVTLQATYDAACAVIRNGVPGDFCECGVWAGANSAAMARAIMEPLHYYEDEKRAAQSLKLQWPTRRVHLFDSFEGIPPAGPHDTEYLEAGHPGGLSKCSIETTRQQMKAWGIPDELLVYHPGWFADSVADALMGPVHASQRRPGLQLGSIALLRLDGDLYESTKESLRLYQLVSVGGIVIVDDWTLSGVRKAMTEYFGAPGAPGPVYFHKEA